MIKARVLLTDALCSRDVVEVVDGHVAGVVVADNPPHGQVEDSLAGDVHLGCVPLVALVATDGQQWEAFHVGNCVMHHHDELADA